MSRAARAAVAAALWVAGLACSGLLVDKGNAFPCDFSLPEGARDAACPDGWVCGVSNVCHHFQYEGPQFEGAPPLPVIDAGVARFPAVLRGPVRAVLPDPRGRRAAALLEQGGELEAYLLEDAKLHPLSVPAVDGVGGAALGDAYWVVTSDGRVLELKEGAPANALNGNPLDDFVALRVSPAPDGGYLKAVGRQTFGLLGAGEVVPGALPNEQRFRPFVVDGGADPQEWVGRAWVREVRWLPRRVFETANPGEELVVPVVVSPRAFYYRAQKGPEASPEQDVWVRINDEDLDLVPPFSFRHDRSGNLWAVTAPGPALYFDGGVLPLDGAQRVLSTWSVSRDVSGARATRAWADCRPCGNGRIVSFSPAIQAGTFVEVLCEAAEGRGRALVKVVGPAGPQFQGPCLTEPLADPIDWSQVNEAGAGASRRSVVDTTLGDVAVLGGRRGELWAGERLSLLAPARLDRVPLSMGSMDLSAIDAGAQFPLVVADRYVASPLWPDGFLALRLEQLTGASLALGTYPRTNIGESNGWLVLSSGDLAQVRHVPDGGVGGLALSFGPRLVDGRGDPAREPFFAEAFNDESGVLRSMVLTADDSLYFYPRPATPAEAPGLQGSISPQLTPEPSFPIRSMTLERSGLGTDGERFARGYLVTSRNLYEFSLSGQPPRWSARPILLSAGEPVEVWMDHPRGGLGRVGYRDGTVFTLPGGFPLVQSLPRDTPDGGTDRVLDYENLGGWPVALAESGLYVAGGDGLDDGKLDTKFPDGGPGKTMTWRAVTLADGGQPWVGEKGKLWVLRRPTADEVGRKRTDYVLYLFGQHGQLYEVGLLQRYDAR